MQGEVDVVRPLPVFETCIRPNSSAHFLEFVEETCDTMQKVKPNEFAILLKNFNAHIGNDAGNWNDLVGQHVDAGGNDNGQFLLHCDVTTHCAS